MGALDASLGMKAQLALGRSWPLASHLPGAPASGLTEKKKYMPCVKFLTDQYRPYSPLEPPEQRCALPGSTVRSAQPHWVCDCVLTTPVVNHIVSTKVRHLSPWQTFFRFVFEHKALEKTCEYFAAECRSLAASHQSFRGMATGEVG